MSWPIEIRTALERSFFPAVEQISRSSADLASESLHQSSVLEEIRDSLVSIVSIMKTIDVRKDP